MPRPLHAASCVRNSLSHNSVAQHIWVSDELLEKTFKRFTSHQRRYGSNVPGPLESRRRATKRRNTSLAHHNFEAPPLDPAVAFGPASSGWWQATSVPVSEPPLRLLPSWLFQSPEAIPDRPNVKAAEQNAETHLASDVENDYKVRLQKCSKLKAIRSLIKSQKLNLRTEPDLAKSAFLRLLQLYWAHPLSFNAALAEFLTDPELNPPGSSNHLVFLRQLGENHISRKSWDLFVLPAFQKAISLGLVSVDDLQEILLNLPKYLGSGGLVSKLENGLPVAEWHRLLTSTIDCQVLSIKDFDHGFLKRWQRMLAATAPCLKVTKLMWRLQEGFEIKNAESFAVTVLPLLRKFGTDNDNVLASLTDLVNELPVDERGSAMLLASQRLVAWSLTGHVAREELELWHHFMLELDSTISNSITIDRTTWEEACVRRTTLTAAQNLMTLAWTLTSLLSLQSRGVQYLNEYGVTSQFESSQQGQNPGFNHDVLGQMIMTLDTLPLPGKDLLHHYLSCSVNANLMSLFEIKNYDGSTQKFFNRDFRVLEDDQFHHWAKQNSREDLVKIAESVNADFPTFSKMCQVLIMSDKTRLKIIRRILEHNLSLKLKASFWPEHVSMLKDLGRQFEDPKPREVIDFVHQLALATAVSPALEPKTALRNVQYFYDWLQRYNAPILAGMSRALWHAGVTRWGKGGCPNAQLNWCLAKVEEIEGSEVKRLLLWSAGYRRHLAAEMAGLQSVVSRSSSLHVESLQKVRRSSAIPTKEKDRTDFTRTGKTKTLTQGSFMNS